MSFIMSDGDRQDGGQRRQIEYAEGGRWDVSGRGRRRYREGAMSDAQYVDRRMGLRSRTRSRGKTVVLRRIESRRTRETDTVATKKSSGRNEAR
jgi:hypothetical protein